MRQPTIYLPHGGGPCFFMEFTAGAAGEDAGQRVFADAPMGTFVSAVRFG